MLAQILPGKGKEVPVKFFAIFILALVSGLAAGNKTQTAPANEPSPTGPGYTLIDTGAVTITARLKPRRTTKPLTVGDQFWVELAVRHHRNIKVSEPFAESLGSFVILDRNLVTRYQGDTVVNIYELKLAAFAPGERALPLFLTTYPAEGKILAAHSDSIPVKVASVLPEDMKDINDLKPQIPFPNLLPLWLALGLLAAAVLSFVGIRLFRRWRKRRLEPALLPEPWEEALAALEAIPTNEWLSAGKVKRYYYAVSDVLKRYLTRRYSFPAIDQTTSEMRLAMKRKRIAERADFIGFFQMADMVKYATYVPALPKMEQAAQEARELVNKTTPQPETVPPET